MIAKGRYVKGGAANSASAGGHLNSHLKYLQCRIEVLDDLANAAIAGRGPSLFFGNGTHLTMNGGHRTGRGL
jgi:hypothetical protein